MNKARNWLIAWLGEPHSGSRILVVVFSGISIILIAVFCFVYLDLILTDSRDNLWAATEPLTILILCMTLALLFSGSVVNSVRIRTQQLKIWIQALAKENAKEAADVISDLDKELKGVEVVPPQSEESTPATGTIELPTDPFQES